MVTAISADQAATFSILRRPPAASDRLPGGTFEGGGLGRLGLTALARRASTQIGDVWVVPGNGSVALYDGSATANPMAHAATRGMVMWGSSANMRPNVVAQGLVPDGVEEVTLFAAGEPLRFLQSGAKPKLVPVRIAVQENVYGALLPGEFLSGRFSGPAGTVQFGPWAH